MKLIVKLNELNNAQLVQLAHELRLDMIPEDALIREVIKGTDVETTAIHLAFIAVGATLAQVLADRLVSVEQLLHNAVTK